MITASELLISYSILNWLLLILSRIEHDKDFMLLEIVATNICMINHLLTSITANVTTLCYSIYVIGLFQLPRLVSFSKLPQSPNMMWMLLNICTYVHIQEISDSINKSMIGPDK